MKVTFGAEFLEFAMILLDDSSLERSSIVSNSRMNRERGAVGINSYEKDLGLDPIDFLTERLQESSNASWLDLCCGQGRALIDAAKSFRDRQITDNLALHGIDLVDMFDAVPSGIDFLRLETASLHCWEATRRYDLITCVHGIHYVGDKLTLIERATGWLTSNGIFTANLDLANLRLADGEPLGRKIAKRFHDCGMAFNSQKHLLVRVGNKSLSLGYRYVGADDKAGPNYSGQEVVDSYYEPIDSE